MDEEFLIDAEGTYRIRCIGGPSNPVSELRLSIGNETVSPDLINLTHRISSREKIAVPVGSRDFLFACLHESVLEYDIELTYAIELTPISCSSQVLGSELIRMKTFKPRIKRSKQNDNPLQTIQYTRAMRFIFLACF